MKLLQRILRTNLLYAALVLVATIPVLYYIIRALCMGDVDDALHSRKEELRLQLSQRQEILQDLPWNDFDNNITLYPAQAVTLEKDIFAYSEIRDPQSHESEPYRELHTVIHYEGKSYPVVLRISLISIEDLIQGIMVSIFLLIVLIFGGLIWITQRQSKKIWGPFYEILQEMQHYSPTDFEESNFQRTDIKEFKELQSVFCSMAERTRNSYLQQKEFTANAAHEMQTPLAGLQSNMDLFFQDEQLTQKQAQRLSEMEDTLLRMSRLNKTLLLLAKIENGQFHDKQQNQIAGVLSKILTQIQSHAELKNIQITTDFQDETWVMDPTLLYMLLTNLLLNAVQNCPENGRITVRNSAKQMEIINTGAPLPFPEDQLFIRFRKTENRSSVSRNGLGLSIVAQIAQTAGLQIEYQYKEGAHHFSVIRRVS